MPPRLQGEEMDLVILPDEIWKALGLQSRAALNKKICLVKKGLLPPEALPPFSKPPFQRDPLFLRADFEAWLRAHVVNVEKKSYSNSEPQSAAGGVDCPTTGAPKQKRGRGRPPKISREGGAA